MSANHRLAERAPLLLLHDRQDTQRLCGASSLSCMWSITSESRPWLLSPPTWTLRPQYWQVSPSRSITNRLSLGFVMSPP